jgi:hypothetical protein
MVDAAPQVPETLDFGFVPCKEVHTRPLVVVNSGDVQVCCGCAMYTIDAVAIVNLPACRVLFLWALRASCPPGSWE